MFLAMEPHSLTAAAAEEISDIFHAVYQLSVFSI